MRPPQHIACLVADNVPSALVYLDSELRIHFVNRYCFDLLGYAPREILGRGLAEVVDAGTLRYARQHAAELERGNAVPFEYVLRHKDGSPRYLKVRGVSNRDRHGRSIGYYACTSDNSTERAAHAALRIAQLGAVLNRAAGEQIKRDRVARAGHELRTPLASVIAALELLREGAGGRLDVSAETILGLALQNADRLSRRVEMLLELESIEPGAPPARADPS